MTISPERFTDDPPPAFIAYGPEDLVRPLLDRWEGKVGRGPQPETETIQAILARHGEATAARVLALVKKQPSHQRAILPLVNLEAARTAAAWLSRSPADREFAEVWLERHAAAAAALLIPDVLGKAAKPRQAAARALRHLAEADQGTVEAQAAEYGEAAAAAVGALLDVGPLAPQVERIPKPGAWADPAMLPPVLLLGREATLPAEAVRTLMTALALDDPDNPYAGVDVLTAECDPASLAAFSWALFELWVSTGAPPKDRWAMDQLRRFADDDAVRRLTALIREWPGQRQSGKAMRGLEILGDIGSEAALGAVHYLSRKAEFKALKKNAAEQIEIIAERLELTTEELADRSVPDFGLGEASALVADYGSRTFTVGFDETLRPFVVDQAGQRRASLPKPASADDLELAQPAYERFAALRRELKTTAAEQVKRLERAMARNRTWSYADFRRYLVDHPLMRHLSSRLVWQADVDGGRRAFRLAEDRTFADLDDEAFVLPDDAVVRIAHPITLGDEVDQWAEILSDYEILQPFEQLGRPVLGVTDAERASGRLTRFEGAVVSAWPLAALLKRGWQYGDPRPQRHGRGVHFEFPGGGHLHIDPEPGIFPGADPGGDQKLALVEISLPDGDGTDPVLLSEALTDVARLARAA